MNTCYWCSCHLGQLAETEIQICAECNTYANEISTYNNGRLWHEYEQLEELDNVEEIKTKEKLIKTEVFMRGFHDVAEFGYKTAADDFGNFDTLKEYLDFLQTN